MVLTNSDSAVSFGGGLDINISPDISLNAEYIVCLSENDYDYSGFNLGFAKSI